MACKLVCNTFACSIKSLRAASPNLSTSVLFLRGDMARTSFSSMSSSTTMADASRETIILPLVFLLPIFGRDNLWLLGRALSSSLAWALESGDGRGDVSSWCIE
jgi:hypothetical protein